jgi:hypothetical protein
MALTILVTGRESGVKNVANGHVLVMVPSSAAGNVVVRLDDHDFVFQHANNSETDRALRFWNDQGWREKVVLFSGGSVKKEYCDQGFAVLDRTINVSMLDWSGVPRDFRGVAAELLRLLSMEGIEVLPAIAILCQGYLAVHAAYGDGQGMEEVEMALRSMGWDAHKHAGLVKSQEKLEAVNDLAWWLDTFEVRQGDELNVSEWQKLLERFEGEWGRAPGLKELEKGLMTTLERLETPCMETVAKAYNTIVRRFSGAGSGQ